MLCAFLVAVLHLTTPASTDQEFQLLEYTESLCPESSQIAGVPARSDMECSVLCSQNDDCKSYSQVSVGNWCLMSDKDNCTLVAGVQAFAKGKSKPARNIAAQSTITCYQNITSSLLSGTAVMFMQRFVGDMNFSRPWTDYEAGFGNCSGDFWLGLRNINILIGSGSVTWRVEMLLWTGVNIFVEYSGFTVGNSSTNYYMTYTAMANRSSQVTNDGMSNNKNVGFSTMDRDNDKTGSSCTTTYNGQGGFWLGSCGRAFPTAAFPTAPITSFGHMIWDFSTGYTSLKEIRMYLKR